MIKVAIIDGSEDTLTLECCKYCGCLLFMPDYYSRWDVNILRCDGCLIEYFDNEIAPKMQKTFSSIQKNITNEDIVYKSANTKEFYEQKSIEQFGTPSRWYELFIKEEVSKLPSYSQHKGKIELSNYYDRQKRIAERKANPVPAYKPYVPKCPTCGSANVQKISDLRKAGGAILFGIFSKDAKSQFECRNCGYKW